MIYKTKLLPFAVFLFDRVMERCVKTEKNCEYATLLLKGRVILFLVKTKGMLLQGNVSDSRVCSEQGSPSPAL